MINCIKAHLHVHTDIFCVGVYKSMLDKTCCISTLNIRDCILSPGHSRPWMIDGAVVIIECVSPAVRGGQICHTVLYIECMFVSALDARLKASLKDPL